MTTEEDADTMRDVVAIITAVVNGDHAATFQLIDTIDDPRAVIAGMCGVLQHMLPQWADALGVDLRAEWEEAATDAALRMARGERLS